MVLHAQAAYIFPFKKRHTTYVQHMSEQYSNKIFFLFDKKLWKNLEFNYVFYFYEIKISILCMLWVVGFFWRRVNCFLFWIGVRLWIFGCTSFCNRNRYFDVEHDFSWLWTVYWSLESLCSLCNFETELGGYFAWKFISLFNDLDKFSIIRQ